MCVPPILRTVLPYRYWYAGMLFIRRSLTTSVLYASLSANFRSAEAFDQHDSTDAGLVWGAGARVRPAIRILCGSCVIVKMCSPIECASLSVCCFQSKQQRNSHIKHSQLHHYYLKLAAPDNMEPVFDNYSLREAVFQWLINPIQSESTYGHISTWNVSQTTDMTNLFRGASMFNEDISSWDVSSVMHFQGMFLGASTFNQTISPWKVENGQDFSYMFAMAHFFNCGLQTWTMKNARSTEGEKIWLNTSH